MKEDDFGIQPESSFFYVTADLASVFSLCAEKVFGTFDESRSYVRRASLPTRQ